MMDGQLDDTGVLDFDELSNHLLEQGLDTSPSELHGCLCGLLAAGAPADGENGLVGLTDAMQLDVYGGLAEQVMTLYSAADASLQSDEFDFYPLLPDDSAELVVRTAALGDWSKGFLAGFTQGLGAEAKSAATEIVSEILGDFAALVEAGVDEEAEEEESESSYEEIVEYVRVAVLNLYLDRKAVTDNPQQGDLL